jgi:hypothetical protein
VQGIFILLGVLHPVRIKCNIEDMSTSLAECQSNIRSWSMKGLVACWPKEIAVDRHLWYFNKYLEVGGTTDWACVHCLLDRIYRIDRIILLFSVSR